MKPWIIYFEFGAGGSQILFFIIKLKLIQYNKLKEKNIKIKYIIIDLKTKLFDYAGKETYINNWKRNIHHIKLIIWLTLFLLMEDLELNEIFFQK